MSERRQAVTFVDIPADDPMLAPVYDQPPCPGVNTHPWFLSIEQGQMVLRSGCSECEEAILGPVNGEDVEMHVEVRGSIVSHLEVGGWETPEYTHWWEFVPEHFGRDANG